MYWYGSKSYEPSFRNISEKITWKFEIKKVGKWQEPNYKNYYGTAINL